jgi:hypothetical protein
MSGKRNPRTSDQERFERFTSSTSKWDSNYVPTRWEERNFQIIDLACDKFLISRGLDTSAGRWYVPYSTSVYAETHL